MRKYTLVYNNHVRQDCVFIYSALAAGAHDLLHSPPRLLLRAGQTGGSYVISARFTFRAGALICLLGVGLGVGLTSVWLLRNIKSFTGGEEDKKDTCSRCEENAATSKADQPIVRAVAEVRPHVQSPSLPLQSLTSECSLGDSGDVDKPQRSEFELFEPMDHGPLDVTYSQLDTSLQEIKDDLDSLNKQVEGMLKTSGEQQPPSYENMLDTVRKRYSLRQPLAKESRSATTSHANSPRDRLSLPHDLRDPLLSTSPLFPSTSELSLGDSEVSLESASPHSRLEMVGRSFSQPPALTAARLSQLGVSQSVSANVVDFIDHMESSESEYQHQLSSIRLSIQELPSQTSMSDEDLAFVTEMHRDEMHRDENVCRKFGRSTESLMQSSGYQSCPGDLPLDLLSLQPLEQFLAESYFPDLAESLEERTVATVCEDNYCLLRAILTGTLLQGIDVWREPLEALQIVTEDSRCSDIWRLDNLSPQCRDFTHLATVSLTALSQLVSGDYSGLDPVEDIAALEGVKLVLVAKLLSSPSSCTESNTTEELLELISRIGYTRLAEPPLLQFLCSSLGLSLNITSQEGVVQFRGEVSSATTGDNLVTLLTHDQLTFHLLLPSNLC